MMEMMSVVMVVTQRVLSRVDTYVLEVVVLTKILVVTNEEMVF